MKGDFTRRTFAPSKHYSAVLQQQGRVALDADWNEQVEIGEHRDTTTVRDVIGVSGAPMHEAAFGVMKESSLRSDERDDLTARGVLPLAPGDVLLSAGRIYVNGILCENERIVSVLHQPDLPGVAAPVGPGLYGLYLDVWQRHLTSLDDASLREVALGGPDTATRVKTVWQLKTVRVANLGEPRTCDFVRLPFEGDGTLRARAKADTPSTNPCDVPESANFRRLENQLYRVEIHTSGTPASSGGATFKWSRDNGSIVTRVTSVDSTRLTVTDLGRDVALGFAEEQSVELLNESLELNGAPGEMARIKSVNRSTKVVTLYSAPAMADITKMRRWDSAGAEAVRVAAGNDGYIALEDGVEVRFESGTDYVSGDYWLIPARTATADVEWPRDLTVSPPVPQALPPVGVVHNYSRLALLNVAADGSVTLNSDCRRLFPPLTELTRFEYLSGDGQEVMPDLATNALVALPYLLQVGVANGEWPVNGAEVLFKIVDGNGEFADGSTAIVVPTVRGIASCNWLLRPGNDRHQVRAILINSRNSQQDMPITFNATLSVASAVAYEPGKICGKGQPPVFTVQEAIDRLTSLTSLYYAGGDGQSAPPGTELPQSLRVRVASDCGPTQYALVRFSTRSGGLSLTPGGGHNPMLEVTTDANGLAECYWLPDENGDASQITVAELIKLPSDALTLHQPLDMVFSSTLSGAPAPDNGFHVVKVLLARLASSLENDAEHTADDLLGGVTFEFDAAIAREVFVDNRPGRGRPIITLTLEIPVPSLAESDQIWGDETVGYQPLILAGVLDFASDGPDGTHSLRWRPTVGSSKFLRDVLFQQLLKAHLRDRRVLARLRVYGNFVWTTDAHRIRYLDGNVFGIPDSRTTRLNLPSGDDVRGGDFEMWFWLIAQQLR